MTAKTTGVPVARLQEAAADLGLILQAGEDGLEREITEAAVCKPGLVLAGLENCRPGAVHALGRAEADYLSVRSIDDQQRILREYAATGVPCVVLCHGLAPTRTWLQVADATSTPLFTTLHPSSELRRVLVDFLVALLDAHHDVHGVLLQIHDMGVLLTGPGGVGKSEAALELIMRGHRLVCDDAVRLTRQGDDLVGSGPPGLGHYMAVRGLGVLHAGDLFGSASVLEQARIDLVVDLVPGGDEEDPAGLDDHEQVLLGCPVPRISVPVRPGRNLAAIVEVATRNQILKNRGIHSAARYAEELHRRIKT